MQKHLENSHLSQIDLDALVESRLKYLPSLFPLNLHENLEFYISLVKKAQTRAL